MYVGHVTEAEHERSISLALEMTQDALTRPDEMARVVVIVETDERPTPLIRKRLAAADAGMPKCDFAFVTRSVMARAAMTAISWMSPERAGRRRRFFSTFEEAREWLVGDGADGALLDSLHHQVLVEANT